MIPYSRQEITESDIRAVVQVLHSDYLTQGPVTPQFESAIAKYVGAAHATAFNSATSALHVACLALGLGPGDWLWTSPITFVASANCALYCGAKVDFVDIDPRTYNLSVDALTYKLEQAERKGCLPKVVVAVHLGGQSCEMDRINRLSKHYGFRVIEDASHAIGGSYKSQRIGNCRYSDITVFSFHPVKIITSGEGGAALTNDSRLAQKMTLLRSHGITREADQMTQAPDGPWCYQQLDLGYNYRMTDLHAALGLNQLERINRYVGTRHEIFHRYEEGLAELPLIRPWQHPDSDSASHLYVVRLKRDAVSVTHGAVFQTLRDRGVGVSLHYIPVYRQPYFARMGFENSTFPESENYYAEAMSLPMYPTLTHEEQDRVIEILKEVLIVESFDSGK